MIALVPSAPDADRLAVDGGDDPGELHLTLAYLGDDVTGWPADNVETLLAEVRERTGGGPVEARVMAHAVFNPDGHAEREPCAVYLVADSDRLGPLRAEFAALLNDKIGVPAQHEPFLPHITAGYGLDPGRLSYTGPITFNRIRVALADQVTDIPLDGPARDEPTELGADDVEEKQQATNWLRSRRGAGVDGIEVKADTDKDGIDDAQDPSPKGSAPPARSAADSGGKKRHVASEAGSKRYGLPIGAELGKARNAAAQKAQDDPKSREAYQKLLTANPRDYRAMLDGMSPAELEALTRTAYSFRSSNPQVVQARIALANALRRRGKDVNDFGGLGKSTGAGKPPAAPGGKPAAAKSPGKTNRAGPAAKDPTWVGQEDWQSRRTRRVRLGLQGTAGSAPPSAKQKRGEGGAMMTLHVYEDGSWQYKGLTPDAEVEPEGWVIVERKTYMADDWDELLTADADTGDVEGKARTTTKPWEKGKAERAGKTIGKAKGDDGDEYPIKTIGDVAAAIKRTKAIKDPDRLKTVRAHIRSGAAKINASNMIPKEWGSGGGDDKGKGGGKNGNLAPPFKKGHKGLIDPDTLDAQDLAAYIEAKVMSPDPKAAKLREYWAHGKGRSKWRPGTPGDFDRLRKHLRKYVPPRMLNGLTANIHKLATGKWPGPGGGPNRHKTGEPGGIELKTIAPELVAAADALDPDAGPDGLADDDAVSLALDRYADMAGELTTEEEYEQALAEEIDWDLLADGTLQRSDGLESTDDLDPDADGDDETGEDPADPDDAIAALEELYAG